MNRITTRVALEVASHEALVRQAYKDSGGTWTWSVGITSSSGHSVERYIDNPQPLSKCLDIWLWALERYAADVLQAFAGHTLTEAQFAAALSFHWNTGKIRQAAWVKRWKKGDVAGAKKAIMDWKRPAEIIPRRRAERDLFFDGTWSNRGFMTEYTRLKSDHTPDRRSDARIDVSATLSSMLGGATGHYQSKPASPDVEPIPRPEPKTASKEAPAAVAVVGGAAGAIAAAPDWWPWIVGAAVVAVVGWIVWKRVKK